MPGTFKFELVSPEKVLLSGDAEQVVVPGADGDFTVLAGHAPLVSTLRPGTLDVTVAGGRKRIFVRSGFAEVESDRLTILVERAFDVEEASAGMVAEVLKAAEAELGEAKTDEARMHAHEAVEQLKALQGRPKAA